MIDHITKFTTRTANGSESYWFHVYYTRNDGWMYRTRRYRDKDNLPMTATLFLLADDTKCETHYTETGKVEYFTK